MKKHRVFSLFTVIFVAFLLCRAVTIVPTGYTGVKTSFGQIQETTIQSGKLNFTVPDDCCCRICNWSGIHNPVNSHKQWKDHDQRQ